MIRKIPAFLGRLPTLGIAAVSLLAGCATPDVPGRAAREVFFVGGAYVGEAGQGRRCSIASAPPCWSRIRRPAPSAG